MIRPSFKTSEFLLTVAFLAAEVAQSLTDEHLLKGQWATIGAAIAVAGYAISRGVKKQGTGTTPDA